MKWQAYCCHACTYAYGRFLMTALRLPHGVAFVTWRSPRRVVLTDGTTADPVRTRRRSKGYSRFSAMPAPASLRESAWPTTWEASVSRRLSLRKRATGAVNAAVGTRRLPDWTAI